MCPCLFPTFWMTLLQIGSSWDFRDQANLRSKSSQAGRSWSWAIWSRGMYYIVINWQSFKPKINLPFCCLFHRNLSTESFFKAVSKSNQYILFRMNVLKYTSTISLFLVDLYIDEKKQSYNELGFKRFGFLGLFPAVLSRISRAAQARAKSLGLGGL